MENYGKQLELVNSGTSPNGKHANFPSNSKSSQIFTHRDTRTQSTKQKNANRTNQHKPTTNHAQCPSARGGWWARRIVDQLPNQTTKSPSEHCHY